MPRKPDELPPMVTPKDAVSQLTVITGNGGEIVIRDDGTIVDYYPSEAVEAGEHDGYADIKSFDVKEWRRYYKQRLNGHIDILDIGYWGTDGEYEPAEPDYRNEIADQFLSSLHKMVGHEVEAINQRLAEPAFDKWDMVGPEEGDEIDTRIFIHFDGEELLEVGEGVSKAQARSLAALLNKTRAVPC